MATHKQQSHLLIATKLGLVAGMIFLTSPSAFANTGSGAVIEKVLSAYGGEKLLNLKSAQINDDLQQYGQTQTGYAIEGAHGVQLSYQAQQLTINFELKTKQFKRSDTRRISNHGGDNMVVTDRHFIDNKGYVVDHCLARYQDSERVNWQTVDYGLEQTIDTFLVKQLTHYKEHIKQLSSLYIQGELHEVLSFSQQGREVLLYINAKTGLLTRMRTNNSTGTTQYDYLSHDTVKGIPWASEILISRDTQPLSHITQRQLAVNLPNMTITPIPEAYAQYQPDAFLDFPTPSINELASGVYLVGQGWGFTLFIDNGDHYISVGAWQMPNDSFTWQQRLDLLHQTTGQNKPVERFIVTHHHDDHLMGLNEVIKHGAKLLVLPEHLDAVKASVGAPITESQLSVIADMSAFAKEGIGIIDVPSSHAAHNLVVYLPEHKLLFAEDMFGSSFAKGYHSPNSWPMRDVYYRTRKLNEVIQQAGLEIQTYASSHHGRVFSQKDLNSMLTLRCPSNEVLHKRLFGRQKNSE